MIRNYSSTTTKTSLRLVAGAKTPLVAAGVEPDTAMTPGTYIAKCQGARIQQKGKSMLVVLLFEIVEGRHAGTALRQWLTIPDFNGKVPAGNRYYQQCAVALGGQIEAGASLDPEEIFVNKTFVVDAGYRLTVNGRADPKNAATQKDDRDFLRVHRLTEVVP